MSNAEKFGMMDGAYFVSRSELLDWLNSTLGLNYTKVEQCCSGVAHLQIVDAMFPGKAALHKANFDAKLEHEYIANFKLVQSAFTAAGVKKVIEIERLVKGKYQDNLEFLQWMKRFADAKMPNGPANYDPVAVREAAITTQRRLRQPRAKHKPPQEKRRHDAPANTSPPTSPPPPVEHAQPVQKVEQPAPAQQQQAPGGAEAVLESYSNQQILDTLEAERDFYYAKLRQIELLCLEEETQAVPKSVLKNILYATSEHFEAPGAAP